MRYTTRSPFTANTPVQLGPHTLRPTVDGYIAALAPMANITNPPFRALAKEHGCAMTVTEMISAEHLLREGPAGSAFNALRMERAPGEDFYVVQLFGGEPESMAEAARVVEAAGADVIDVNMGCPVRKISGRGNAGVALMREPERAAAIVRAMVAAVRVPVTAKIRAGWDAAHVNAVEVARGLEDAGAAMVAVHARTRDMVHAGEARLAIVRAVKEAVRLPVFGNGGVRSLEDARRMVRETGCDGVMIGRGAHGNPWLFRALASGRESTVTDAERCDAMERHVALYAAHAGAERTAREMRKHLLWYLADAPGSDAFRARLHQLTSLDAVRDALAWYRDSVRAGVFAAPNA